MHTPALCLRACLLVAALAAAALPGRADAGWSDVLRDGMAAARATEQTLRHGMEAARATEQTLREKAEQAIVLGGVLVYRHRHAVAGAALGCVAGSVAATTTTLGAALASGGASLTTTAPAAALGCGLGALGGAAIGQRLDSIYDAP
jgi:Tfp pilus assembly protein PilV